MPYNYHLICIHDPRISMLYENNITSIALTYICLETKHFLQPPITGFVKTAVWHQVVIVSHQCISFVGVPMVGLHSTFVQNNVLRRTLSGSTINLYLLHLHPPTLNARAINKCTCYCSHTQVGTFHVPCIFLMMYVVLICRRTHCQLFLSEGHCAYKVIFLYSFVADCNMIYMYMQLYFNQRSPCELHHYL